MPTPTNNQNEQQAQEQPLDMRLQRMLIIGLGGTGGNILLESRKLLVDKFGSIAACPWVEYLCIDTDDANQKNPGASTSQKKFDDPLIGFTDDEYCHIGLPTRGWNALYANIKNGNQKEIRKWFDIDNHINIDPGSGAGGFRQLGRLAFWNKYSEIERRIKEKITRIQRLANADISIQLGSENISVANKLKIFVVYGMAGGTGCGTFLDAAYLARAIGETHYGNDDCKIIGLGLMPSVFMDTNDKTVNVAAGYAALKELNYYTYSYAKGRPLADIYGEPRWA